MYFLVFRFTNCHERNLDGDHSVDEHCLAGSLRYHHLLHHRLRAVHGSFP